MSLTRLGLMGASGRLGRAIASLALKDPTLQIQAALTHLKSSHLGTDLGLLLGKKPLNLPLLSQATLSPIDVYIDVSLPQGLASRLEIALKNKTPLVIGSTGLSEKDFSLLQEASIEIPLFYTSNFSLGMALLQKLARDVSASFYSEAKIFLKETHHTQKKDAPSGSAKQLAQVIEENHPFQKKPTIESVRTGQVVGEHELCFQTPEEQLVLSHTVHTRDVFAKGALTAACFVLKQPPGFYSMTHLIA